MFDYTPYEMLYAVHVIEGRRTIESVPAILRENVAKIVADAVSKKSETGENV